MAIAQDPLANGSATRYWAIAPVEANPPELYDKIWQFDLANGLISIGWKELGDVARMSHEQLADAVAMNYPNKPPPTRGLYANMIWAFYQTIRSGDVVIARRGRKMLTAVGMVKSRAFYAPGKNPILDHPNFLEVQWQDQPRDKTFPSITFPMFTVAELPKEKFTGLLEETGVGSILSDAPKNLEDPSAFVLEKYLEDFIVSNFNAIFKGELAMFCDADGNGGQQYTTDIGSIDILAVEPKSKSFVVLELKKGRPSDQVVGQVLRYMGWVKKNLCAAGQGVKGIVICRESDPKLSYVLEVTSNVEVQYYNVSFKLSEAPAL